MTTDAVTRTEDRGMLTIRHGGWSVTATTAADRAWAERALAARLGIAPNPSRHGCGHDLCHDADGHTDGCLYDDGAD